MALAPTLGTLLVRLQRDGWNVDHNSTTTNGIVWYSGESPDTFTRFTAKISTSSGRILQSRVYKSNASGRGVMVDSGNTIRGLRSNLGV